MAAPFPSFVPPEPVIEAYVAALQAARPRQDTFAVQRASLLLAGLDRPEVDITLRAFAATLQPREEWERGASPRTLGRALDLHGAERVLRLTEDAWDLHAFAWWQPAPHEVADAMERLRALHDVMARPVGSPLVPLVLAHLATHEGAVIPAWFGALAALGFLQEEAVAMVLGSLPPACRLAPTIRPPWVPRAHAVELRDPLTACLRRQVLHGTEWRAPTSAPFTERPSPAPGLILLDVDHMKRLNDVHGLPAGDSVLRAIADRLQRCVGDRVIRWAGEEFVVVWEGEDVAALAAHLVEDLASLEVPEPYQESHPVPVTVSAGSSTGADLLSTLRRADEGVLEAKRLGRRRAVHVREPSRG